MTQMLLQKQKKKKDAENLQAANVRLTTDVPATDIVDPTYIPEDGEESEYTLPYIVGKGTS